MHEVLSRMAGVERSVEDCSHKVDVCTHKVDAVAVGVSALAARPASTTGTVIATPPSVRAVSEPSTVEPPRKQRRVQVSLLRTITRVPNVPAPQPSVSISAVKLTISKLFKQWYEHKLYVRKEDASDEEKALLWLFARVVCYAKRFLPPDTILTAPPSITAGSAVCEAWRAQMTELANRVERGVMQHIFEKIGGGKRKQPFVQGCMKHLPKIPKNSFPVVSVVDQAYIDSRNANVSCYYYNDIMDLF